MKSRNLVYPLLLFSAISFAQTNDARKAARIDSVKKNHFIHAEVTDVRSTTVYKSGKSTKSRNLLVEFRVGDNGIYMPIGKKGKALEELIKNDPEAHDIFKKANSVHLRKKRLFNTLEVAGYVVTLAGTAALFIGLDDFETEGVTPMLVVGGVGVIGGITQIIVSHKLTDKHLDAWAAKMIESTGIYNRNLLAKIK